MIRANHEARPMNRRQKPAAEDTALLISQSQSNTSLNGKQTYTCIHTFSLFFPLFHIYSQYIWYILCIAQKIYFLQVINNIVNNSS